MDNFKKEKIKKFLLNILDKKDLLEIYIKNEYKYIQNLNDIDFIEYTENYFDFSEYYDDDDEVYLKNVLENENLNDLKNEYIDIDYNYKAEYDLNELFDLLDDEVILLLYDIFLNKK